MKKTLIIFISLLLSFTCVKADSWNDPTWQMMIDSSDVIGLFQITSEGDFRAKAKLLKSYKGHIKQEDVWISGFSNRYGPVDTMRAGEKYILFLNHHAFTKEGEEHWLQMIEEEPELTDYYEAIQKGLAYRVWTPTSGDILVDGGMVRYDLLKTSHSSHAAPKPFLEFDQFLSVAVNTKPNREFQKQLLHKLKRSLINDHSDLAGQYLMMLHLTGNRSFKKVFKKALAGTNPSTRLALARHMGNIKSRRSREILVSLLKDSSSVVQGEAVRQLSTESADFLGPVLLAQLEEAGSGSIFQSNSMDPVRNELGSGKVEIVRALGEMQYKPAAKKLLPLLRTDDEYLFGLLISTLQKLENKEYIPYMNEHLKRGTESLIFDISRLIAENDLEESKQALMAYISSHERTTQRSNEFTISTCYGLGHFQDQETIQFLLSDFKAFLQNIDSVENTVQSRWLRQYVETFAELKVQEAKPLIYKSLFHWHGLSYEFALNPELFFIKAAKEDSVNIKVKEILQGQIVEDVQTLAFVKTKGATPGDGAPGSKFIVQIRLKNDREQAIDLEEALEGGGENMKSIFSVLDSVQTSVSRRLGIPLANVIVQNGSYVTIVDHRFNDSFSLLRNFYDFATALPNAYDLRFLKAFSASGIPKDEVDLRLLNSTIEQIEEKLKE